MLGEPNEDQRLFLESVDRFMATHLPPEEVRRRDNECNPPYHLLPLMGQAGFLGVPFPERFGGLGRSFTDATFIQERLARLGLMAASLFTRTVSFGGMSLLSYGSTAHQLELMPALLRGELLFAMALSEPGAGSDAAGIQTRAEKTGDGWRITGRKTWISDADRADYLVMPCRTGARDSGKHGISVFLVPRRSDGLSMTPLPKIGHHCMPSWDVGIDGVLLADEMLMGEVGQGMRSLQSTLQYARAGQAASALGQAQAAIDLAVAHARERHQFGQPIGSFQAIQHMLADMQTRVDLSRLMLYKLAALIDAGRPCRRESAQAKLSAAETFHHVADRGMQVLASAGYSLDSDMQRYWRDSRLYTFGEGSIEIMRSLIARDMGL
jgi:alkylation response protein AidB-like acyl-CoA dehydrogenase